MYIIIIIMAAILIFQSANNSQINNRNIYLSFLQRTSSNHIVFSDMSDKTILGLWTNQNTQWTLVAMLNFQSVPKKTTNLVKDHLPDISDKFDLFDDFRREDENLKFP